MLSIMKHGVNYMKSSTEEKQLNLICVLMGIMVLAPLFLILLIVDVNNPITILVPFMVMGGCFATILYVAKRIESNKTIPSGREWNLSTEVK